MYTKQYPEDPNDKKSIDNKMIKHILSKKKVIMTFIDNFNENRIDRLNRIYHVMFAVNMNIDDGDDEIS